MGKLIAIICVLTLFPLALPTTFQVERSLVIDVSRESAYSYLVNLESWKEWNPLYEKDPKSDHIFSGIPGVVGSSYTWKGTEIGAGQHTLIHVEEPKAIHTSTEISEPKYLKSDGYIELAEEGDRKVRLTLGMKGEFANPYERLWGLIIDFQVGPNFEKSLKNIKFHLEQSQQSMEL